MKIKMDSFDNPACSRSLSLSVVARDQASLYMDTIELASMSGLVRAMISVVYDHPECIKRVQVAPGTAAEKGLRAVSVYVPPVEFNEFAGVLLVQKDKRSVMVVIRAMLDTAVTDPTWRRDLEQHLIEYRMQCNAARREWIRRGAIKTYGKNQVRPVMLLPDHTLYRLKAYAKAMNISEYQAQCFLVGTNQHLIEWEKRQFPHTQPFAPGLTQEQLRQAREQAYFNDTAKE